MNLLSPLSINHHLTAPELYLLGDTKKKDLCKNDCDK